MLRLFKQTSNSQKFIYKKTQHSLYFKNFTSFNYSTIQEARLVEKKSKDIDIENFPLERIRNFSIIAHIDHGKSTLADRLLEITGTIDSRGDNKQVLDKLKVERERGITVKAQSVSMICNYKGKDYLLNLIDTPGHVDFSYEVSRSLAACQGTLLVVDVSQGIQAQTVANFYLAFAQGLKILPIFNKIDLPGAQPEEVMEEVATAFDLETNICPPISAKSGINLEHVIPAIIDHIPPPTGNCDGNFKALLFDNWYDTYKGVICLIAVVDGSIKKGDKVTLLHNQLKYTITEIGIIHPNPLPTSRLLTGQVGYCVLNMKSTKEAKVGDTLYLTKDPIPEALPGFNPSKPMVFAGVFPTTSAQFNQLEEAIERLTLNDSSVTVNRETSLALGQGWRLGFLGTLHLDVFRQRLEEEYQSNVIITNPTVPYQLRYLPKRGEKIGELITIRTPHDFPDPNMLHNRVEALLEPIVKATFIFPTDYLGPVMELIMSYRAENPETTFLTTDRAMLRCTMPLAEIVTDFYDALKSNTAGYASFDYEEAGYKESDLVKMTVMLNSEVVDVLTSVHHRSKVTKVGRDLATRLKDVIEKQLFEVSIQTAVNKKIIARETIPAMRKNVTAKCYGGDASRKMKLLAKQKEGKKKLKMIGNVQVPHEAFLTLMERKKD